MAPYEANLVWKGATQVQEGHISCPRGFFKYFHPFLTPSPIQSTPDGSPAFSPQPWEQFCWLVTGMSTKTSHKMAPKSREILTFVCLQKDVKQCCKFTKLYWNRCSTPNQNYDTGFVNHEPKKFQEFSRTFKDLFHNFPGPKITNRQQNFKETTCS